MYAIERFPSISPFRRRVAGTDRPRCRKCDVFEQGALFAALDLELVIDTRSGRTLG